MSQTGLKSRDWSCLGGACYVLSRRRTKRADTATSFGRRGKTQCLTGWSTPILLVLTHARAAFAVQVVQTTETLFATGTVGQVAFARLCDHALGHDGRADGFVASVTDVRERHQRTDDRNEKDVFHLADAFHMRNVIILSRNFLFNYNE